MSYFSLIYLGIFLLIISVLSFFNIIYSYYFNLYLNLDSYVYSLILSLILGLIFLIKKKDNYKISIYNKILTVISGYFVLPIIISIPFYFSIYNISFLDSYFESVSGFTSTGFTIFENVNKIYKINILDDCFKVSDVLNVKKFVKDFFKLLSKISINKIIENKK